MTRDEDFDLLITPSKDEVFSLNNTVRWKTNLTSAEDFESYIKEYSRYYFSPLNNIFLFMVKELSSLSYFNKVLVRDGLLSLKLFFLRNPSPQGLKTKLIIHSSLSSIIPKEWGKNVYLFKYNFKEGNINKIDNQFLAISYHPDSYHTPEDVFENQLRKIKNIAQYKELMCLVPDSMLCSKDIYSKATLTEKILRTKVRAISLSELPSTLIEKCDYLEINPYNYLFTDCYIRWHLLYHGARPLKLDQLSPPYEGKTIHEFMLSPYHSIEVFSLKELDNQSNSINERQIFSNDIIPNNDHTINLCSSGYKRYVFTIAQKNASDSN